MEITSYSKAIIDEIKSQESKLENLQSKINEYKSLIVDYESKINVAKLSIKRCKEDLEQEGVNLDIIENMSNNSETTLSNDTTYRLLIENDRDDGLQVKHLVKLYKSIGIHTHGRLLFRQLEELMNDNKVYQINPGIKRGRRYRFKDKSVDNGLF